MLSSIGTWIREAFKKELEAQRQLFELGQANRLHRGAMTTVQPASDQRPYHENFEFIVAAIVELADVLGQLRHSAGRRAVAPVPAPRRAERSNSCRPSTRS